MTAMLVVLLLVTGAGALLELEYLVRRDPDRTPHERLRRGVR